MVIQQERVGSPLGGPFVDTTSRTWRIALIGAGIIAVIVVLALWVSRHRTAAKDREQNGQDAPMAVSVAPVSSGDIVVRIPGLGAVTPLATVTVRTQISGQLQKIAFTEGQLVHQGDFLAQIDPRPYEAALNQMKANLARDQALLADARLNLKRYQDLIAEDSIAQQQLDTQKSLVAQYEGTVAGDEAQINTAAVNLQYTHITSPVTGRVGLRQVDQGNYVTPQDTNGIVVITQLEPISAIFSVPEDFVPSIARSLHAGNTLTVEAYDRSNSNRLAVGKLLTLDNQIDATTGTIKLRALFDNQEGILFPNQFVNIQLIANVLRNQIIMPNAAVHRGAPNGVVGTFVYLVKSDKTVTVRPVTLGTVDGEHVAVASGLKPGDLVVTDGGDRLRDGASIVVPENARPREVAAK